MNYKLAMQIQNILPELQLRQVYKFGVHAAKGPWDRVTVADAFLHLQDEVRELERAISDGASYETVADECADVANMAAIIMSNYKQLMQVGCCNATWPNPEKDGNKEFCNKPEDHEGDHNYV